MRSSVIYLFKILSIKSGGFFYAAHAKTYVYVKNAAMLGLELRGLHTNRWKTTREFISADLYKAAGTLIPANILMDKWKSTDLVIKRQKVTLTPLKGLRRRRH